MSDKLNLDDLKAMFGTRMPMEVVTLMQDKSRPFDDFREQLIEIAERWDPINFVLLANKPIVETIIAAAVQVPVEVVPSDTHCQFVTISAPPPARHHSLLPAAYQMCGKPTGPDQQGFVTSHGRFVGRVEAKKIAVAANQKLNDIGYVGDQLFSENLW